MSKVMCWIMGNGGTRSLRGLPAGLLACAALFAAPVDEVSARTNASTPTATISAGITSVIEGGSATFTVTLSSAASAGGLTINLSVADVAGSDFVASTNEGAQTMSFSEGETSKSYGVATVNDENVESNGDVTVTLTSGTGYSLGTPKSASVLVKDNDPTATISAGITSVIEGGSATFTVTLSSAAPAGGLTINLSVADVAGSDFVASANEGAQTMSFSEGETSKSYGVATVNDGNVESNGDVTVTLTSGTGYSLGTPKSASVLVKDNDPTIVTISTGGTSGTNVTEGGPAVFFIHLSGAAPEGGLTINLSVADVAGSDFVASANEGAQTRSFSEGQTMRFYAVATFNDGNDENDGDVTVTLTSGTGYSLGTPKSASVLVKDNDPPGATDDKPIITIYYDQNYSAAATDRYLEARKLLNNARRPYQVRFVTGNSKVDKLAGVSGSVMPRFFLDDPEELGWGPSEPKVNNGGLKWLRSVLQVSASKPVVGDQADQVLSAVAAPNPFNPSTTIRVQLPASGPVSLTIYNMAGQVVRTLWDGRQVEAGDYAINWDSRDQQGHPVSSGVYLYVLRTHQQVLKHKMVLIR